MPVYRIGRVTARLNLRPWEISAKQFRHTYCSSRLQTLDGGQPVSIFTVARELGHGGDALVRRIHGHLGQFRHRPEVVEYWVASFPHLAERLDQIRSGTVPGTAGVEEVG